MTKLTFAALHGSPEKPLRIGDINIECYVLEDKRRVLLFSDIQHALGMAAGAQRIAVYKMADTAGDVAANPEPFGLVRADGSYRPAFSTFQLATTMLAGATRVIRDQWDEVGQVTVEQPGGTTTVLFSRVPGPRVAQVPANGPTAILVDMWGNRQSVSAANGVFTIELPAAPCSQS